MKKYLGFIFKVGYDYESQKPEEILESNTNSEEWRLELERVLPLLKVAIKTGKLS